MILMFGKRVLWSWHTLLLAWLLLATAVGAATSFRGLVPLDARTGQAVRGLDARFEFPILGAVLEPLMAPAHIILGSPNYRVSALSFAVWLVAVTGCAAFWISGRRNPRPTLAGRLLVSLLRAVEGAGILGLYALFVCLVRLPGHYLVVTDPGAIVADLHSHTMLSHDAIVTQGQNLAYHRERDFAVVGITDHHSAIWQSSAFAAAEVRTPEIVRGVELRIWGADMRRGYLLALGLRRDLPFTYQNYDLLTDDGIREFIAFVKNVHGGAVIAMYINLSADDIERLAAEGVDAFEIANFGHPELAQDTREALLAIRTKRGTALLANSDWHGWSGFARTWNVIRPGKVAGSPGEQVVGILRAHDPERIVPIVSQMIVPPSPLRAVFAPIAETVRYAAELSPARLMSWWGWSMLLVWAAARLRRGGVSPGRFFLGLSLLALGGPLAFCAAQLGIAVLWGAPHSFALVVAAVGSVAGIAALAIAAIIAHEIIDGSSRRRKPLARRAVHAGSP
jgi:hypothetical protein